MKKNIYSMPEEMTETENFNWIYHPWSQELCEWVTYSENNLNK